LIKIYIDYNLLENCEDERRYQVIGIILRELFYLYLLFSFNGSTINELFVTIFILKEDKDRNEKMFFYSIILIWFSLRSNFMWYFLIIYKQ